MFTFLLSETRQFFFFRALEKSLCLLTIISFAVLAGERMLIVRCEGKSFVDAARGIKEELEDGYSFSELIVDKGTDRAKFANAIASLHPGAIFLMDNQSFRLYRKFQSDLADSLERIPAVLLMGVFIEKAVGRIDNAAGVAYEVPLVTSAISLRSLQGGALTRIGVVYRAFMRDYVKRQQGYCTREGIEIIAREIKNEPRNMARELAGILTGFSRTTSVDALWIPNDNGLLNSDLLQNVWLAKKQSLKFPLLVGVDVLVKPPVSLGTLAVLPDNRNIGMQAAQLMREALDNDHVFAEAVVQEPLSVLKILNFANAKDMLQLHESALEKIDRIIK
ncbi:MAG: hypothetical protein GF398_03570 [Chitinivibrionales bacterium]|nr:hypothetical protein [Chitinivibrionales bacterium]